MSLAHVISEGQLVAGRASKSHRNRYGWMLAMAIPSVLAPLWVMIWRIIPHPLTTTSGLFAALLLITCTITDLRRKKIHNWATYSAMLWALGVNAFATFGLAERTEWLDGTLGVDLVGPAFLGAVGFGESFTGAFVCFATVLIAFNMARGGAGDVKLAAALGALLGVRLGILAVSLSYIVAAASILIRSIFDHGGRRVLIAFARQVGSVILPNLVLPPTRDELRLLHTPMPLAPSFAIGTLLVLAGVVRL
jgi:Flp pilus assembly protein protease CpaA